ncbi:MAG TPA: hypothetical protein VL728_13580 [Cyclobacteriaceae bacterium]|jgi:hypothetical protein|nr:hypothetical protein [Cyclobacteriaceae bacterium]
MRILPLFVIGFLVISCNRGDHKKETISGYVHYVWKRQPGEIEIKKMEDIQSITGKDSIDLLIKEYAKGITPQPTLDSILSNIDKDIAYNSNLLARTNQRIDSLTAFQKKTKSDDGFLKDYMKTFTDLRDFTRQTVDEMKLYRNSFKRYSEKPDAVFCYAVLCQYKLRGHAPDTTSKMVTQTFFLTPDTRRIFLVK